MDRIRWACSLSTSDAGLDTGSVRGTGHVHLSSPGVVRGDDIYGAGPNHHALRWRTSLSRQVGVAHQDLRGGGCVIIRDAGVR